MVKIRVKKIAKKLPTHFATAKRSDKVELYKQIDNISVNPIINELLKVEPGLLAILNSNRQVITVNRTFIESLQIEHASELLGLRLGESLNCDYSKIMPGGCGTSEYCISCGAAIAMVSAIENNKTVEKKCIISAEKDGKHQDFYFNVKAAPFNIEDDRFILLYLRDITGEQQRAYLERVFFHDLANLISALDTTTVLLERKSEEEQKILFVKLKAISNRLVREVEIHRLLIQSDLKDLKASYVLISVTQLIQEIKDIISLHKSIKDKTFDIQINSADVMMETDPFILSRIILNMLINAFEASEPYEKVKLIIEVQDENVIFKVWNNYYITKDNAKRIFQRNFSTKEGVGRGLGTYSMKLFGENLLKGEVGFESFNDSGTTFYIKIPYLNT